MKLNTPMNNATLQTQQPQSNAQLVQFKSAVAVTNPVLQKYAAPKVSKFTQAMDYRSIGDNTVNMIKLIYGSVILSRFAAAATRSWNELRETVTRDTMGYTFWLFLVPILQRLAALTVEKRNPDLEGALVKKLTKPDGTGFKNSLKKLMYNVIPTSRWKLTSSQEIQDWAKQAKDHLKTKGVDEASDVAKESAKYFEKLLAKRRNITGLGFAITIGMIGIGINLFNMYMTEKAVKAGKVGKY